MRTRGEVDVAKLMRPSPVARLLWERPKRGRRVEPRLGALALAGGLARVGRPKRRLPFAALPDGNSNRRKQLLRHERLLEDAHGAEQVQLWFAASAC